MEKNKTNIPHNKGEKKGVSIDTIIRIKPLEKPIMAKMPSVYKIKKYILCLQ